MGRIMIWFGYASMSVAKFGAGETKIFGQKKMSLLAVWLFEDRMNYAKLDKSNNSVWLISWLARCLAVL